jgi:hypothetical protein
MSELRQIQKLLACAGLLRKFKSMDIVLYKIGTVKYALYSLKQKCTGEWRHKFLTNPLSRWRCVASTTQPAAVWIYIYIYIYSFFTREGGSHLSTFWPYSVVIEIIVSVHVEGGQNRLTSISSSDELSCHIIRMKWVCPELNNDFSMFEASLKMTA